jgi:hypothetical protein
MLHRSPGKLTWFPLLILFAAAMPATDIPKGWREFVSEEGGYIAYYPRSWHFLGPKLPTLYIATFPFSKVITGTIIPGWGATISIVPPPAGVTTISEWIKRDRAVMPVESEKSFTVQRPPPKPPLHVTEVTFEPIEGVGGVNWYFDLSGRLLVARLSYYKGNPKADRYRQALLDMVRLIAPLAR